MLKDDVAISALLEIFFPHRMAKKQGELYSIPDCSGHEGKTLIRPDLFILKRISRESDTSFYFVNVKTVDCKSLPLNLDLLRLLFLGVFVIHKIIERPSVSHLKATVGMEWNRICMCMFLAS